MACSVTHRRTYFVWYFKPGVFSMHFRSMETDLDKKSFRVEDFQKLSFSDTKVDFVSDFYIIRVTSAVLLCNVPASSLHYFLHFHIDRDITLWTWTSQSLAFTTSKHTEK